MTKEILLNDGSVVFVDAADYEWLNRWKWQRHARGYAIRTSWDALNKKFFGILMHRLILDVPKNMDTDHINGNKLDNRRCNLRICTTAQNIRNQRKTRGTSKYKGVSWSKQRKKWVAFITINHKRKNLGGFNDEAKAALTYNKEAKKHFGEFARLNSI